MDSNINDGGNDPHMICIISSFNLKAAINILFCFILKPRHIARWITENLSSVNMTETTQIIQVLTVPKKYKMKKG